MEKNMFIYFNNLQESIINQSRKFNMIILRNAIVKLSNNSFYHTLIHKATSPLLLINILVTDCPTCSFFFVTLFVQLLTRTSHPPTKIISSDVNSATSPLPSIYVVFYVSIYEISIKSTEL
jgi:hypothetical protein